MIRINLFGPTVVVNGDLRVPATELGGVKPRQLLEMLAVDLGEPLSKDLLAERLWEAAPPASYIATIESYVCVLRNRARLGQGRRAPLATTTRGYLLDPEQVTVDLVEARGLLGSDDVPQVARALDLSAHPLLAGDPYATWAHAEREAFSALVADACVRASRTANATGAAPVALRLARAAAANSYLSEPAARELMRALELTGEGWQAVHVYHELRGGMMADLGVEPGADTVRQYLAILGKGNTAAPSSRLDEIGSLLRLLRVALEGAGDAVRDEAEMQEVGRLLLARCS